MIKNTYGIPMISIEALIADNIKEFTRLQHPGASALSGSIRRKPDRTI